MAKHETYLTKSGDYESVYGNMPLYGLGKALKHIPISEKRSSTRKRFNMTEAK